MKKVMVLFTNGLNLWKKVFNFKLWEILKIRFTIYEKYINLS